MEAIIIVVVVLEKMRDEWIDFLKWYSNVSMSNRYYHSPPHVTRKKKDHITIFATIRRGLQQRRGQDLSIALPGGRRQTLPAGVSSKLLPDGGNFLFLFYAMALQFVVA